jgi:hypothetical protein
MQLISVQLVLKFFLSIGIGGIFAVFIAHHLIIAQESFSIERFNGTIFSNKLAKPSKPNKLFSDHILVCLLASGSYIVLFYNYQHYSGIE